MGQFFGMFEQIRKLIPDQITEYGIYDDIFSNVYRNLSTDKTTLNYFIENAYCVGKQVLEIACGDGSNFMIPMAKKGFEVDGVEISQSMVDRFNENAERLPARVKNNLKVYCEDIFEFEPEHLYDLIIIPSTTICLLAQNDGIVMNLFAKAYAWLRPGGRFMLDYRTDQILGNEYESNIFAECNQKDHYMMYMQEFNNYVPGVAIVNMYVEHFENGQERKLLASSEKRIITNQLINKAKDSTDFIDYNSYEISLGNATLRLRVFEKAA